MTVELTKEIAYKNLQKFFNERPFVILGSGTSSAVDVKFGMGELQRHLEKYIPMKGLNSDQKNEWSLVTSDLDNSIDLETSMNLVKDEKLKDIIVECTAELISSLNKEYEHKILLGETNWPTINIMKKLVDARITDRALHVATTNYDCLIEYALEKACIPYITGFIGGIDKTLNWNRAMISVGFNDNIQHCKQYKKIHRMEKHIRLYKVHGSLNTFKFNNRIHENNSWMINVPEGVKRCMITPGASKFESILEDGNELIKPYYSAIENHNAFLFIGFGFNDKQLINNTMINKLNQQKNFGLIITKDNNDRIKEKLEDCENLWIVCKHQHAGNESTRIYNKKFSNWLYLEDKQLWKTDEFSKEILGG